MGYYIKQNPMQPTPSVADQEKMIKQLMKV